MPGKLTASALLVFATLTVANCVISDNSGSGVENLSATVTIIDSTISGNSEAGAAVFTQTVSNSPGTSQLSTARSVAISPLSMVAVSLAAFRP